MDDNPPVYVDDDSDSEEAFEIGIANANKQSLHQYNYPEEESIDSFAKPSNRGGGGFDSGAPPGFMIG